MDLTKRTALVTGAASGIGAAVGRRLAAAGATVHLTDIDVDEAAAIAAELRASGADAEAHELDVTDAEACRTVAERIDELSVLVTCAGWVEIHPLVAEDSACWRRVTDVNFLGTVHACAAAMRVMAGNGGGSIVTISSEAGRIGAPREAVYAGAKAGVIALTKSIARERAVGRARELGLARHHRHPTARFDRRRDTAAHAAGSSDAETGQVRGDRRRGHPPRLRRGVLRHRRGRQRQRRPEHGGLSDDRCHGSPHDHQRGHRLR